MNCIVVVYNYKARFKTLNICGYSKQLVLVTVTRINILNKKNYYKTKDTTYCIVNAATHGNLPRVPPVADMAVTVTSFSQEHIRCPRFIVWIKKIRKE